MSDWVNMLLYGDFGSTLGSPQTVVMILLLAFCTHHF